MSKLHCWSVDCDQNCNKCISGYSLNGNTCVKDEVQIMTLNGQVDPDTSVHKLKQCEGDCDRNTDCEEGLVCYHR